MVAALSAKQSSVVKAPASISKFSEALLCGFYSAGARRNLVVKLLQNWIGPSLMGSTFSVVTTQPVPNISSSIREQKIIVEPFPELYSSL